MKIRVAELNDIDVITEMHQNYIQCWQDKDYFEWHLDQNSNLIFIAEKDAKILGYILSRQEGDWIHLVSMAVVPQERIKGIGKGLVLKLLKGGLERGLKGIYGHVRESNTPAIKLYETTGFSLQWIDEYEDGDGKLEFTSNITDGEVKS